MRIAMYHCRLPEPGRKPGGVEVFVDRLAGALGDRGHDVVVWTYAGEAGSASYRRSALRPRRAATSPLVRQYVAPWAFNVRPRYARADVVHLHGDDWFWWRRRVPTVRTFYGSALLEALTATSLKRRADQALVFALELLSRRLADATYGIGPDSRTIYRTDGVLQLGVPGRDVERRPAAAPTILFVGTWEGRKRGALLHEAFQRDVRPVLPNAELWMVSDRCEPGPGVRFIEHPSDADLRALFERAWIFCLPSAYEGFGLPYLEAMAAGVPVVATPNPGAEDLLRPREAGLLVEPAGLGPALRGLLGDDAQREALAARGRERAEDFSWERVGAAYEAAYALAVERFREARG